MVKVQYYKRPLLCTNERKSSSGKLFQQLCSNMSFWWLHKFGWHFYKIDKEYCAFCWIVGFYDILISLCSSSHKTIFFFEEGVSKVSNTIEVFSLDLFSFLKITHNFQLHSRVILIWSQGEVTVEGKPWGRGLLESVHCYWPTAPKISICPTDTAP